MLQTEEQFRSAGPFKQLCGHFYIPFGDILFQWNQQEIKMADEILVCLNTVLTKRVKGRDSMEDVKYPAAIG